MLLNSDPGVKIEAAPLAHESFDLARAIVAQNAQIIEQNATLIRAFLTPPTFFAGAPDMDMESISGVLRSHGVKIG